LMAPRVDRTIARVSPPGGARRRRSARIDRRRSIRDLERTPNPFDHPLFGHFLSLFKGQGAAVRGDDRVVNVRHGKYRGGRLAQLVRALP
jgi:hypothetical protein